MPTDLIDLIAAPPIQASDLQGELRRPWPTHSAPRAAQVRRHLGFTLVELLIVVTILAILAAIVVPAIGDERTEAVVSSLKANVSLVSMTLEYQRQKLGDGTWPLVVDQDWFASARYPYHPDRPEGVAQVEDVTSPGKKDPSVKLLTPGSPGAYWYNCANGIFRARVADQGSAAANLELYNRINQTSLTSLGSSGGSTGGASLPKSTLGGDASPSSKTASLPAGG